jgi:hypothetical protein
MSAGVEDVIETAVHPVVLPLASNVTWATCVESPQEPTFEFTVASVKFGCENVTSPVAVNPPNAPPLLY